jgi:ankyrin repeat protein
MSKRGAQLALGPHESESPLKRWNYGKEEEVDLTLIFPDEVLSLILSKVVIECQTGLARPVRLVCRRWNTILMMIQHETWTNCMNVEHPSIRAARIGDCNLISYYYGAKQDKNKMLEVAARGGHLKAMHLLKKWGAYEFNWALYHAAEKGHLEAMRLLKKWGATDFDEALRCAASVGQLDAMRLLKKWGANYFNAALRCAASVGHLEAMHLLKKWGADDFDAALFFAATDGCLEAMRLLKEWGATDFNRALRGVREFSDAWTLLQEWKNT